MADKNQTMSWYVLRAISGKEGKVKEYVEAAIQNGGFDGHVSQILVPTEKVVQMRNGKRVVSEKNYLPGYVLVEALLVGETTHRLRSVPNVLGFLPDTTNPTPLREVEVNRILGRVDELPEENADVSVVYEVGDVVKVTEGPFAGFTGAIEKVDNNRKQVSVVVKIFGRSTPIDLGFMQVEKDLG